MLKQCLLISCFFPIGVFADTLHCYGWTGKNAYDQSPEKIELSFKKDIKRPDKDGEFIGETKNFQYKVWVGDISPTSKKAIGQHFIYSKLNKVNSVGPFGIEIRDDSLDKIHSYLALQLSDNLEATVGCVWK